MPLNNDQESELTRASSLVFLYLQGHRSPKRWLTKRQVDEIAGRQTFQSFE
jgi:hypothetical protein